MRSTDISAPLPAMKALYPAKQPRGRMRTFPLTGRVLVGFGKGRIDLDRSEQLVQPQPPLHRGHEFDDQFSGVLAHDGRAQNPVATRTGQHFDESAGCTVDDRPIEIVE